MLSWPPALKAPFRCLSEPGSSSPETVRALCLAGGYVHARTKPRSLPWSACWLTPRNRGTRGKMCSVFGAHLGATWMACSSGSGDAQVGAPHPASGGTVSSETAEEGVPVPSSSPTPTPSETGSPLSSAGGYRQIDTWMQTPGSRGRTVCEARAAGLLIIIFECFSVQCRPLCIIQRRCCQQRRARGSRTSTRRSTRVRTVHSARLQRSSTFVNASWPPFAASHTKDRYDGVACGPGKILAAPLCQADVLCILRPATSAKLPQTDPQIFLARPGAPDRIRRAQTRRRASGRALRKPPESPTIAELMPRARTLPAMMRIVSAMPPVPDKSGYFHAGADLLTIASSRNVPPPAMPP
ncbi:hypothetical protein OH76DRAFT_403345 [Lentinus brumalis]|uniref:Uncharacterized protein n=1 Tax=Lentinus brumalis TaxID=2498619 RepID=A0A371DVR5_9APHY|nr:hypothetical protein OH76DRAFT_403345 [Polyporus brumalis]